MKKVRLLVAMIIVLIMIIACGAQDEPSVDVHPNLIGKWISCWTAACNGSGDLNSSGVYEMTSSGQE
jgi:hypothetical protein